MLTRTLSTIFFVAMFGQIVSSQIIQNPAIPCTKDDDCGPPLVPEGAKCASNLCVCTDNKGNVNPCSMSHSQPRSAVVTALSNHTCKSDRDCKEIPNLFCNTTISHCDCSHGYILANASFNCLPISTSVGAFCEENDQCSILNSTCRNKQCVCSTGFHYSENSCWKSVEMGKVCTTSQECSYVPGAVCNDRSLCTCANETVLNADGQRCLPVVKKMLEPCVESVQCSKTFTGAKCIEKRCKCDVNNHFDRRLNSCVATKHLGDRCSINEECYQEGSGDISDAPQICFENVCMCNEKLIKDGDKCVSSGGSLLGVSVVSIAVLLSVLLFATS